MTIETTIVRRTVETEIGGARGESQYQLWLRLGNGGTEQDYLDWLAGQAAALAAVEVAAAEAARDAAELAAESMGAVPTLDLPDDPTAGQRVVSAVTGQELIYDERGYFVDHPGEPFATIYSTWQGEAGQLIGDAGFSVDVFRPGLGERIEWGFVQTRSNSTGKWALNDDGDGNGDGTISPLAADGFSVTGVPNMRIIPNGSDDFDLEVELMTGTGGADANPLVGFTDGQTSCGLELNAGTGRYELFEHRQGAITLHTKQSRSVADFSTTEFARFRLRKKGHLLSATHVGADSAAEVAVTIDRAPYIFIGGRRTSVEIRKFLNQPRDLDYGQVVGDVRFVGPRTIELLVDCDDVAVLDERPRGKPYLLVALIGSQNSASLASPAQVRLGRLWLPTMRYEALTEIDANSGTGPSDTDRIEKLEGVGIGRFGEDILVFTADQSAGRLVVYRMPDPENPGSPGHWPRAFIAADGVCPNAHTIRLADLDRDGVPEVYMTVEGVAASVGTDQGGGIFIARLTGFNPLTPANWTTEMVRCEGAWGFADRQFAVDLYGDGKCYIPFSARGTATARNTAGAAGMFALDITDGPAGALSIHTIRAEDEDCHVFTLHDGGDGHGFDLCYSIWGTAKLNLLQRDAAWAKTTHDIVSAGATDPSPWKIFAKGMSSGRSVLWYIQEGSTSGGLYSSEWNGSAYADTMRWRMGWTHPYDNACQSWVDLGNGLEAAFGGDSRGNAALMFAFESEAARRPIEPPAEAALAVHADAQAIFDRWDALGVPASDARKTAVNVFVHEADACGYWALLKANGALWGLAAHAEAAAEVCWTTPSANGLTKNGTVTFTVDKGVVSDGSTGYYSTAATPAGLGLTQNAIAAGCFDNLLADGSTGNTNPCIGSPDGRIYLRAPAGSGTTNSGGRMSRNSGAVIFTNVNHIDSPHHGHLQRTAASGAGAESYSDNGLVKVTGTAASNGLADGIELLRSDNGSGTKQYSNRPLLLAYVGPPCTSTAMELAWSLAVQKLIARIAGV